MERSDDAPSITGNVARLLDRYAALTAGDLPGIAACYTTPALVLGSNTTIPVASGEEVEAAFRGAADAYRARGLVEARPTIADIRTVGSDFVSADVRWDYLDAAGASGGRSAYRYLLRRLAGDGLGIQVVIETAAT